MTLTLDLSPEEEKRLRAGARNAGLDINAYLRRLTEHIGVAGAPASMDKLTLAESLKEFVGVIDGTPGPGDGRAWSEIEAASDPL
jgi:hypothetical protein